MGVKYSSSESEILIETMSHNIQIAFQITERLERGSVHLISVLNTDSLQGKCLYGWEKSICGYYCSYNS